MGYEEFLTAMAEHRVRCTDQIASILSEELLGEDWGDLDNEMRAVIDLAAKHVLVVLNSAGWEMQFRTDGTYSNMVT